MSTQQGIHIQLEQEGNSKPLRDHLQIALPMLSEFNRISSLLLPLILSDNRSFLDNRHQQLINLLKLVSHETGNNTLWPLFMDGVQLPQGCGATTRRQFTSYHLDSKNSWYSFDRPWKDDRLSWTGSHPVVLNMGPLAWESSALTLGKRGRSGGGSFVKKTCF